MTHDLLQTTIDEIAQRGPTQAAPAMAAARELQGRLTKPAGSLGELEEISVRLAGLTGKCPPPLLDDPALAIFAGDHGVHGQGVTPWPQAVTGQMVGNFLAGGAAVNALARQVGVAVTVVDVGVLTDLPGSPQPAEGAVMAGAAALATSVGRPADAAGRPAGADTLIHAKVRAGTRDMTVTPALTREETVQAIEVGIAVAQELIDAGARALLTGDMGIANTTPSAALIAVFTGRDVGLVTGYGTGIDAPTHLRKIAVIRTAIELHRPDPADPIGVLAAVGGLEHAALTGYLLGAAARQVPVLLDGVIAASAALAAAAIAPNSRDAMIAAHRSVEPGATVALAQLELTPLLDLGLRLGEGTGAVLAYPIVASAVRVLHEMATFDSAGVSGKE